MEIDYINLMHRELGRMIQQKRELGVKANVDAMKPSLVAILPEGKEERLTTTWKGNDEKRAKMFIVATFLAVVDAEAIIISSDIRSLNVKAFCERFNMAMPTKDTFEAWEDQRQQVMSEHFGSYMGNMPD